MILLYLGMAFLVGAGLAIQPPLNLMLTRALGSEAAVIVVSTFVAFCCALGIAFAMGAWRASFANLLTVPWWAYLGGAVGAFFVGAGVVVAPATGALLFFVAVVAGQLAGSMLLDHFGAFGLEERTISLQRVAGAILVVVGAILVTRG